jgi:hypothetical protein
LFDSAEEATLKANAYKKPIAAIIDPAGLDKKSVAFPRSYAKMKGSLGS